jgi:hypothetical protein
MVFKKMCDIPGLPVTDDPLNIEDGSGSGLWWVTCQQCQFFVEFQSERTFSIEAEWLRTV